MQPDRSRNREILSTVRYDQRPVQNEIRSCTTSPRIPRNKFAHTFIPSEQHDKHTTFLLRHRHLPLPHPSFVLFELCDCCIPLLWLKYTEGETRQTNWIVFELLLRSVWFFCRNHVCTANCLPPKHWLHCCSCLVLSVWPWSLKAPWLLLFVWGLCVLVLSKTLLVCTAAAGSIQRSVSLWTVTSTSHYRYGQDGTIVRWFFFSTWNWHIISATLNSNDHNQDLQLPQVIANNTCLPTNS